MIYCEENYFFLWYNNLFLKLNVIFIVGFLFGRIGDFLDCLIGISIIIYLILLY